MKDNWKPGKLELRIQEFTRSKASKQLLCVPYDDFARAVRHYVRWEAFSLWIRAISEFESQIPHIAHKALQKHCPRFLKYEGSSSDPTRLGLRFDEWISRELFRGARRQGWFEAVLFYALRAPRLKYAYTYREQCSREWTRTRPSPYPEFESWFQAACNCNLFPVNADRLAKAVENYLDWLSLAYWLEPLLEADVSLPSRLSNEIKEKGRGFSEIAKRLESDERCAIATRFHLMRWVENRYFSEAQENNWFESVRKHVHNHPRSARLSEYSRRWRAEQPQDRLPRYPSFTNWCRDAKTFVDTLQH